MPLSAASVLHAFLVFLLLLGATASVPAGDGDVNATVFASNATATSRDDTEMYICYLCTGRNPLLIRHCPIYWDECHLVCYADGDASAAAIPAAPAPEPEPQTPGSSANPHGVYDEECYVMKLYRNGSYVIVTRLQCAQITRCLLSCGGGDMADGKALGAAATAAPATTAAAVRGNYFAPPVAGFQRCGTQVTAPAAPPSGVPGGGVRRLR